MHDTAVRMSIYLPLQCSTIHAVEDYDGNDIRTIFGYWMSDPSQEEVYTS